MFEIVHTCTDWYDGPRRGIADYHGQPHFFESEWSDGEDIYADTFLLEPIDVATFQLALEDWAIWRRWETAFYQGLVAMETHPAMPEERSRHREIEPLLKERLVIQPGRAIRKWAEFRVRDDPEWSGLGWRPLEVRWLDAPASSERTKSN